MQTQIEFQEIDVKEFGEREKRGLYELDRILTQEELPEDPPLPYEEWLTWLSSPSDVQVRYWIVWSAAGSRVEGAGHLRTRNRDENRHIGRPYVGVRPERRRAGLGSKLLLETAKAAAADGRTLLQSWAFAPGPGVGFCDALGWENKIEENHNRLRVSDLDLDLMRSWIGKASERASDYYLEFFAGPCPEEWREKFSQARWVMNTAPRSESEEDEPMTPEMIAERDAIAERDGWRPWTYVAVHRPTGEWAGYTRLWPSPFRPELAGQDDTGVMPAHRNRGLGRWLKAAMILKFLEENPNVKWVDTWNASSNAAMLSINHAMGFKAVLTWQTREIASDELIARLAR